MKPHISHYSITFADTKNIFRLIIRLVLGVAGYGLIMSSQPSFSAEQNTPFELIFVTSEHCPFCKSWERDIGQIYKNTPYAKKATLRRVKVGDASSSLPANSVSVVGTPTFVIVKNDLEIGRIEGYQSRDLFFWALSEYIKP